MNKIGTHNSGTGEKSKGIISWLVRPFAKTQSKTILEQYDAGCRLFDLRVKYDGDRLVLAHGLWKSSKTVDDILWDLETLGEEVYVSIAYEGSITGAKRKIFLDEISFSSEHLKYVKIVEIAVKKPVWETLKSINPIETKQDFIVLDGRSWHTYIPIPWLWNKLYTNKHKFNEEVFTYVDFL